MRTGLFGYETGRIGQQWRKGDRTVEKGSAEEACKVGKVSSIFPFSCRS